MLTLINVGKRGGEPEWVAKPRSRQDIFQPSHHNHDFNTTGTFTFDSMNPYVGSFLLKDRYNGYPPIIRIVSCPTSVFPQGGLPFQVFLVHGCGMF